MLQPKAVEILKLLADIATAHVATQGYFIPEEFLKQIVSKTDSGQTEEMISTVLITETETYTLMPGESSV